MFDEDTAVDWLLLWLQYQCALDGSWSVKVEIMLYVSFSRMLSALLFTISDLLWGLVCDTPSYQVATSTGGHLSPKLAPNFVHVQVGCESEPSELKAFNARTVFAPHSVRTSSGS